MKDFYGYSRKRDERGIVVCRFFNDYTNCLHTQVGHARENMEVLIAEFDMSEIKYVGQMSSSQNSRVIDPSGISYAVTNGHKDGEPKIIEPIGCAMRGRNPENPSERGRSNGKYKQRIEMGSNISNAITSVQKDSLVAEPAKSSGRIRKLTPRECFRLMGVTETDIDKIQQSGVSQSQQYKMAGNSIVVDCLFHIFRKMFCQQQNEDLQPTLF